MPLNFWKNWHKLLHHTLQLGMTGWMVGSHDDIGPYTKVYHVDPENVLLYHRAVQIRS